MSNISLFEIIDSLMDKYIKIWEDICNIESPSEDKAAVEKAAQTHFDAQMDGFLTLLRTAARAVTVWRM